jgi:hypothetical protein
MHTSPRHPASSLLLKLLALTVVGAAALWARTDEKQAPGDASHPQPLSPDAKGEQTLRAIGAVHPRLSPDGRAVAFSYQGGIWRLPVESGCVRRLAGGAGFAVEPCWSADGGRIAFLQGRSWDSGRVRLLDAHTGQQIPVAQETEVQGTGPLAFSPDGGQLIGSLRTARQVEALRALDLKSGRLRTVHRTVSSRQPWALSADGRWVAFVTTLDRPGEQTGNDGPENDLWKVALSGGEPDRIVRFPARIHSLCWSADGKALFVSSELGGVHNDLWRLDLADPEHPVKLTFGQADEDRPSVSADGRWLLYADNHEGCPALVLHHLTTGTSRTLAVRALDFGTPAGRLRLKFRDRASGEPAVARMAVQHADGSFYAAPGALWRVYESTGHAYVRGETEFALPAGSFTLRAWHGPEYRSAQAAFEVKAGTTTELTVELERWTDANARGWYSGENHIHANYGYGEYYNTPTTMADACAGEGLNVANFMVANSDGDGVFDREFFRGRPDPRSTPRTVLYWNEEFRSTIWGHMTLVNLQQVVEPVFLGFRNTTNPYDIPPLSDIAEKTHRQGGLVNFTHPARSLEDLYLSPYSAKGLPIYAALGQIDTVDAMGSRDDASTALYHRLLNCGFRLAASAGTDCFLNRTASMLPGGARAYVKLDGPFTYEKWIAGLRAGRSFVSNGPMLELTVDGKGPGDVLDLGGPRPVRVQATAVAQFRLERLEVLFNGRALATAEPAAGGLTARLDQPVRLDRSGWLAVHAWGRGVSEVQGERLTAHTSPVYVRVAGKPAASVEDARYFLAWIDRLWAAVQERDRIPGERWRVLVEGEVEQARKVYQKILDDAEGR